MDRREFIIKSLALTSLTALSTAITPLNQAYGAKLPAAPNTPNQNRRNQKANSNKVLPSDSNPEPQTEEPLAFYISKDEILKTSQLPVGKAFLFYYPFVSTPAILINLGSQTRQIPNMEFAEHKIIDRKLIMQKTAYQWSGGTGKAQNIVAFSAICPHDLIAASKEVNQFSYRHKKSGYYAPQDKVITCCAHGTAYDVQNGGVPVLGPAKKPLTAIKLNFERQTDSLLPNGIEGHNIFPSFWKKNRKTLKASFGKGYKQEVKGRMQLTPLESFAQMTVRCS